MAKSTALRLQLSRALLLHQPADWARFSQLWMAFNAVYGGEADHQERARIKTAIRNHVSESAARDILRQTSVPIERILAVPPGDMRLGHGDPGFRRVTTDHARLIRNTSQTALNRLVALGGVLYQIRCNLLHGSKDPTKQRDLMLVTESVRILEQLVPALQ